MAEHCVRIQGRDPLLFRDGRPFGNELGALTARTLPLPLPGTLAGFLRTVIGDALGWSWSSGSAARRAAGIRVAGPLLLRNSTPLFPAPADALVLDGDGGIRIEPLRLEELSDGAGCTLPGGLAPLLPPPGLDKPAAGYRYWPVDAVTDWLLGNTPGTLEPIAGPEIDERTHVAIDPATRTSREHHLFTTEGIAFGSAVRNHERFGFQEWSLLGRVELPDDVRLPGVAPFGGEGRTAYVEVVSEPAWPTCPPALANRLSRVRKVRMQLATPAVFRHGWRPGWLGSDLTGSPPALPGVRLRLVAAAVPRRQAVSGWDYATRAPKAVRWLAPAGSVYLFEAEGDVSSLGTLGWLLPVSDAEQDRCDGYGLALWGLWEPEGGGL